jgi:cation-transporting ATPase 13A3/4/5
MLQNPLKPNSSDTIRTLELSSIRCIISTGDSHLTGVSVAKSCGIINPKVPLYTGELQKGHLIWRDPTNGISFLPKKCCICVTGEILEYMSRNLHPDLPAVIRSGVVFGRMFPSHKILLIELLQQKDIMVAMVGDGANDCGALKTADVGLSLSKAEASIAAPFCTEDISGILDVLKEGRNALVTSLQSFKFVAMYSFIQFIAVSLLYALDNNLMDMQFLYQDLVIILPISISMAHSRPFHSLAKVLPPGNLFSFSILGSLFGHLFINLLFQVASYSLMLPFDWYESGEATTDEPEANDDNTSVFVISCFQVLIAGIVFNIGPPYRRDTLENFWFTASVSFIVLMTIYLLMVPETIGDWFDVVELEPAYRWVLAILATGNLVICFVHEKFFMPQIENQ